MQSFGQQAGETCANPLFNVAAIRVSSSRRLAKTGKDSFDVQPGGAFPFAYWAFVVVLLWPG
jgi:hypothetical protein